MFALKLLNQLNFQPYMKWTVGVLFLLIACAQVPAPVIAPTAQVVFGCEASKTIGEGCSQTCECLKPGECLKGICSLTKLEDGKPCVENKQCLSGYCTEGGACGGPDGPKAVFDCEYKCRDKYDGSDRCYTLCKR